MDIVCDGISGAFSVIIDDAVVFSYDKDIIKLTLNDEYGFGRNIRKAKINDINSLRILVDSSIIEYYINDGEMVFTTRFYKKEKSVKTVFDMKASEITIYPMNRMTIS
jgi:beta-fructofuranosidase